MYVSKISIHPERSIDLGPRGWVRLSAGFEITLEKDEGNDRETVEKALVIARDLVSEEFKKQFAPFKKGGETK